MDPHQLKIVEAAERLAIKVDFLEASWMLDAIRLTWQGRSELVTLGRIYSHHNTVADQIAANKVAAKALMTELDIPVPDGLLLNAESISQKPIAEFLSKYAFAVAKPLFGTDGLGIGMYLQTVEQVLNHIQSFPDAGDIWLLEAQVEGEDLRLQYLSGKLVAACIRKPCFVVGDGKSSIADLIEIRNRLIQSQNVENCIEIDHQVNRRLVKAGLTLNDVLETGTALQLKDVSNMSQGGHAIDVTDQVHPTYKIYLDRLAQTLGIRLFSLDVMTPNPSADPKYFAHVLEFNAQPAWLHHTFSEERQHDIPSLILKDLFQI